LHYQTHSRSAMLSFYLFQQMQTRYHSLWMHERRVILSTQHIKRSVLQAGHTWGQSLCKSPTLPSPSRWGWEKDSGVWVPHWTCAVNMYMKWYLQKGQGALHLLYWYCWTGRTWWQQILRVHRFHFASNCHMENLSNGILMLHSQTHSRPAILSLTFSNKCRHGITTIVRSLGPRSKALPFFHAFTGCDTVSAYVWKGKKTVPSDLTNIMNWYPSQIFAFSKNHP
jgi:uncharacterized ParB-like nuclease family protein